MWPSYLSSCSLAVGLGLNARLDIWTIKVYLLRRANQSTSKIPRRHRYNGLRGGEWRSLGINSDDYAKTMLTALPNRYATAVIRLHRWLVMGETTI